MSSNQSQLLQVAARIESCTACQLHCGRTRTVPGSGNADAAIMVVGEAPGRNEDEQGLPFVGMAGRFLDKLLDRAGLRRDQVFICNVVKCRPPENRKPEKDEIAACADFLKEQIAIVNPKLIICLGGTAAQALLGIKQIGPERGRLIERDARYYFVAYHPAARFHRGKITEDFDKLRSELTAHSVLRTLVAT